MRVKEVLKMGQMKQHIYSKILCPIFEIYFNPLLAAVASTKAHLEHGTKGFYFFFFLGEVFILLITFRNILCISNPLCIFAP